MRKLLTLGLLLPLIARASFAGVINAPVNPNAAPMQAPLQARSHGGWHVVGRNVNWSATLSSNAGTDTSCTTRALYTTNGAVSTLKLHFLNSRPGSGQDCNGYNPVVMRCSIEYPLGTATQQVAVLGQTTWVVGADNPGTWSDPIGIVIPANTQFAVRLYERVSAPPTSPAAALVSGGSLSTSSTYYYKVTSIDNGIESGPSSEASAAPTSGNQSISVTWTTNANASAYRVYRATSTGSEVYLATVNGGSTAQFIDTGALTIGSGTPPAVQKFCFSRKLLSGESCNDQYSGGNGADATGSTGALSATASGFGCCTPDLVVGDDALSVTLAGLGDSIMSSASTNEPSPYIANWFEAGITTGTNSSINLSIASTKCSDFATAGTNGVRWRLAQLPIGDYIVSNLGINDLAAGATWQTLASNHLTLAKLCYLRGQRYVITTLTPHTTDSADNFVTIANQTAGSYETARENYNSWVRGGYQVSGGSPVLTGGASSPYIYGYFDEAAQVEVNSLNLLTQNGGYWRVPTSATLTAQAATGTPTTTAIQIAGAAYTTNQYINYVLQGTSGVNNNVGRLITSNTSTTFTVSAFPSSPAAGDTFAVYAVYTAEGTHPTDAGFAQIGASFATWVSANVVAFGSP